jgi:hypothetical protein
MKTPAHTRPKVKYMQHYCTAIQLPDGSWSVVEHYNFLTKNAWRVGYRSHEIFKDFTLLRPRKFLRRVNDKLRFVARTLNVVLINFFHKRKTANEPKPR